MRLGQGDMNISLDLLAGILDTKDGRELAEIYENHVPRISFDVEKAVTDMRSGATGGQITNKL